MVRNDVVDLVLMNLHEILSETDEQDLAGTPIVDESIRLTGRRGVIDSLGLVMYGLGQIA